MRSNIEEKITVAQQSHWKTVREEVSSDNVWGVLEGLKRCVVCEIEFMACAHFVFSLI